MKEKENEESIWKRKVRESVPRQGIDQLSQMLLAENMREMQRIKH